MWWGSDVTLSLTAGQDGVLRLFGQDGVEPLYRVQLATGVTQRFRVLTQPANATTFSVQGDVTPVALMSMSSGSHIPDSGFAGIGATTTETAANIAETIRALSEGDEMAAWSAGDYLWVRVDDEDDTAITAGGTAFSGGNIVESGDPVGPLFDFVSGSSAIGGRPASVLEVGGVAQEKDRVSNAVTKAKRELVLRWDRVVEAMLVGGVIIGRTVTITRGVAGELMANWIPSGVWVVVDGPFSDALGTTWVPASPSIPSAVPDDERPPIRLVLEDRAQWLLSRADPAELQDHAIRYFATMPILHAIRDMYRIVVMGDAATSVPFIDETSFDPSDSDWADVSHLNVAASRSWTPLYEYADEFITVAGSRFRSGGISLYGAVVEDEAGPWTPAYGIHGGTPGFEGATAKDVIDELMLLLPGQVTADEDGVVRARRIDRDTIVAGTATIREWSRVFTPSGLSDVARELCTRLMIEVGSMLEYPVPGGTKFPTSFAIVDEASASAHRVRAATASAQDKTLESVWLQQRGLLAYGTPLDQFSGLLPGGTSGQGGAVTASSTHLTVMTGPRGFAGTYTAPVTGATVRSNGGIVVGPSWAQLSSTRLAYLRLDSPRRLFAIDGGSGALLSSPRPAASEIITCDGVSVAGNGRPTIADLGDYGADQWVGGLWTFEIAGRDQLGTVGPDIWLPGAWVTDLTVVRTLGLDRLGAMSWGLPTITGSTPLDQLDVQIGDFVSVPLPHLIGFRGVGASALGLTFEVVSKVELADRIDWTLVLAAREDPLVIQTFVTPVATRTPPTLYPLSPLEEVGAGAGASTSSGAANARNDTLVELLAEISSTPGELIALADLAAPAGADRRLVVMVATYDAGGSPVAVSAIDWGGEGLSAVDRATEGNVAVEIWEMAEERIILGSGSSFVFTADAPSAWCAWAGFFAHVESGALVPGGNEIGVDQVFGSASPVPVGSLVLAAVVDQGTDDPDGVGLLASLDGTQLTAPPNAILVRARSRMRPYTAEIDVRFTGYTARAGVAVALEAVSQLAYRQLGFRWGWDFTIAPSTPGTVPAYWGSATLPLVSGSYASGVNTSAWLARGAIGAARVDEAITPSSARFTTTDATTGAVPTDVMHLRALWRYQAGTGFVCFWGSSSGGGIHVRESATGIQTYFYCNGASRYAPTLTGYSSGQGIALDLIFRRLDPVAGGFYCLVWINGALVAGTSSSAHDFDGAPPSVQVGHLNGANYSASPLMLVAGRTRPSIQGDPINITAHRAFAAACGLYTP